MRPPEVAGTDDPEAPISMDEVIAACGAKAVDWNMKVDCCGGAFSVSRTASVVRLGRAILEDARSNGAEAIVVACPMCHSNLDLRQKAMMERGEEPMPVLFVTQLVGLAFGLPVADSASTATSSTPSRSSGGSSRRRRRGPRPRSKVKAEAAAKAAAKAREGGRRSGRAPPVRRRRRPPPPTSTTPEGDA